MGKVDLASVRDLEEGYLRELGLDELLRRRRLTGEQWRRLRTAADVTWTNLDVAGVQHVRDRACVYVHGSMARGEATDRSDLDLFVIDELRDEENAKLSYVENAHLIAALDQARADAGFRKFSRGGEFIRTHSLKSIIDGTGGHDDDFTNRFTARILLLLNSQPLLNESAYRRARGRVLDRYWQQNDPEVPYLPIMLINDIRRWWGVLGLNFERYNPKVESAPGVFETTAARELQNLKLRYARMLACYSIIAALVHQSGHGGVLRQDVEPLLEMTPVQRLLFIRATGDDDLALDHIDPLLKAYDNYLGFVSEEPTSLEALASSEGRRHHKETSYEFHRRFVRFFEQLSPNKILYEYAIV